MSGHATEPCICQEIDGSLAVDPVNSTLIVCQELQAEQDSHADT